MQLENEETQVLEEGCVGVYVDQNKWDKAKSHLNWIKEQVERCQGPAVLKKSHDFGINHKELERKKRLLNLCATYLFINGTISKRNPSDFGWMETCKR